MPKNNILKKPFETVHIAFSEEKDLVCVIFVILPGVEK
jgi:hypothetical protein